MKKSRRLLLFVPVTLCLLVSGCGSSAVKQNEEFADEMIQCMNEYADALESVKDKDTAKAAAVKMNATTEKFKQLLAKKDKLPKVTKKQKEEFDKKYLPKIQEAADRMKKVAFSAGFKSGAEPDFMEALKRMQDVAKNAG